MVINQNETPPIFGQFKKMLKEDIENLEAAERYHLRKVEEIQARLRKMKASYENIEKQEKGVVKID